MPVSTECAAALLSFRYPSLRNNEYALHRAPSPSCPSYIEEMTLFNLGHPLFFRFASNAFPDIGSVGRIEKKNLKKSHKKSRKSRPWYPRTTLKVNIHIFGLTKCTIYCKTCSCFCSCFSLCCYYAYFSD